MRNLSFKLTNETCVAPNGETLYRIKATRDIPNRDVCKGDKGGFVASLKVNGQARIDDDSWVYDDAQVYGNARVYGNAVVCDNARVYGNAQVYSNALVYSDAQVFDNARVYGEAVVCGDALVNSAAGIIVISTATDSSITITQKLVFIDDQAFTHKQVKAMTINQAKKLGLSRKDFNAYKAMILGGMQLVKRRNELGLALAT
jgi:carbonic anhydrase/acetyltransferase-like protein (isoleucine patch superfamily)